MEITYYNGPEKPIEKHIVSLLKTSDNVSIAVAYVKRSGVNFVVDRLSNNEDDSIPTISIITGFDFSLTDADALTELMNKGVQCHIIRNSNFHPKLYIFEKEDDITVIVGSSNLSEGGLSSNYEANVMIKGKASDGPIKDVLQHFVFLKSNSTLLDKHAVELYKKCKSQSDEIMSKIADDEEAKRAKKELKDYLNHVDEDDELTEHDDQLLDSVIEKLQEADLLFEAGDVHESIAMLQQIYGVFNNLDEQNTILALNLMFECEITQSRAFDTIDNETEAKFHANNAETIGKRIYEQSGDVYSYLIGLSYSAEKETSDRKMEHKCNAFIKFHKNHKEEIDKITHSYSQIGRTYMLASSLKYNSGDLNSATKYIYRSHTYLEKDLPLSEGSYTNMTAHRNLGHSLVLMDKIDNTLEKNEREIREHYETALEIAKTELQSEFWEGAIRLDMADCFVVTIREKSTLLKQAEEIFKSLDYPELIERVHALREKYDIN